ncbi:MAG: hypothetical protein MUP09_10215 [Thiovulaceae bacterium]|nr:hypothetical protein [Sulfurimonadaceae bacterium]
MNAQYKRFMRIFSGQRSEMGFRGDIALRSMKEVSASAEASFSAIAVSAVKWALLISRLKYIKQGATA